MKGRDGGRTDQSLVKAKQLQTLQETGCFLPRVGLQIGWDMALRMNIRGASRNAMSEAVASVDGWSLQVGLCYKDAV